MGVPKVTLKDYRDLNRRLAELNGRGPEIDGSNAAAAAQIDRVLALVKAADELTESERPPHDRDGFCLACVESSPRHADDCPYLQTRAALAALRSHGDI